jgi:hypothetical protein
LDQRAIVRRDCYAHGSADAPQIASQALQRMTAVANHPSRVERLKHEFLHLAIVTLYLYACFGTIIVYKAAVLKSYNIDFSPWGLAFVKALVIAKFFEIGELLNLRKRLQGLPLAWYLLCEVILFAALIVALSFLEEGVVALLHGRTLLEGFSEFAKMGWLLILSQCMLLCLILVPLLGLGAINEVLPEGQLRRMFFGRR